MKIVLVTSPHVKHGSVLQAGFAPSARHMYSFAPVGLLSLAAAIERSGSGDEVELVDINRRIGAGHVPLDAGFHAALAQQIADHSPDLVGFMTECDSYHHVLLMCAALKQVSPHCHVVLGGPHASVVAKQTLARCLAIDSVVIGEGEATFIALLDAIRQGCNTVVDGVVARAQGGEIVEGGRRALIADLDSLPIPAYHLYTPDTGEEIFVEAGRGCPFQCTFCSTAPYWQRRHRVKSGPRLVKELRLLAQLFETRRVHFTHDLFTANKKWVVGVCNNLIEADLGIVWTCSARTDTVDLELLALMARAGCNAIYFGIESGSERVLAAIQKAIPATLSQAAVEACKAVGIAPNIGLIIGFPAEDHDSFVETMRAYEHYLRLGCRPAHIFGYCPFAGSSMFEGAQNYRFSGHFVDIPLGRAVDEAHRQMIGSDPELFSSYYRPRLREVERHLPHAIDAVDEFSPLVEAMLTPALELARRLGGMYEVYSRWVEWIVDANRQGGAAEYRIAYGSPAQFAQFLVETLETHSTGEDRHLAYARFCAAGVALSQQAVVPRDLSIGRYRSLDLPVSAVQELPLETPLFAESVIECMVVDFSIEQVLSGASVDEADSITSFLIWHRNGDDIRLLSVPHAMFDLVQSCQRGPSTVGDLMHDRLVYTNESPSETLGFLVKAIESRIIQVGALP